MDAVKGMEEESLPFVESAGQAGGQASTTARRVSLAVAALAALGLLAAAAFSLGGRSHAATPADPARVAQMDEEGGEDLGVSYLAVGYNIFKGNPYSTGQGGGSVDPGFTMYQVFHLGDTVETAEGFKVPKHVMLSRSTACELSLSTTVSESKETYKDELSHSIGVEVGADLDAGLMFASSYAFAASYTGNLDFQKTVETMQESKEKVVMSSATCSVFQAVTDTWSPPPLTDNILHAVNSLPTSYGDGSEYFRFIDFVGTHYLRQVTLGARFARIAFVAESDEKSMADEGVDLKQGVSMSYGAVNGDFSHEYGTQKTREQSLYQHTRNSRVVSIGGEPPSGEMSDWLDQSHKNPMPIKYQVEPLIHVLKKHMSYSVEKNMLRAYVEYCTKHLGKPHDECQAGSKKSECLWDSDCRQNGKVCKAGHCQSGCRTTEDCHGNAFCRKGNCERVCDDITITTTNDGVIICDEKTNHDKCPDGKLSKDRCSAYAKHRGFDFDTEHTSSFPAGCYLYSKDYVYFNSHSTGSGHTSAQPIRIPIHPSISGQTFHISWSDMMEGAPSYRSPGGADALFLCDNQWWLGSSKSFRQSSGSNCWGFMHLKTEEPLYDTDRSELTARHMSLFHSPHKEWHEFKALLVKCQACNHVELSGFGGPAGYMNAVWKVHEAARYDGKLYRDESGNNYLYYCPKSKQWDITNSKLKAQRALDGGSCYNWGCSGGTSFLAPGWFPWWDSKFHSDVWIKAQCFHT